MNTIEYIVIGLTLFGIIYNGLESHGTITMFLTKKQQVSQIPIIIGIVFEILDKTATILLILYCTFELKYAVIPIVIITTRIMDWKMRALPKNASHSDIEKTFKSVSAIRAYTFTMSLLLLILRSKTC